MAPKEITVEVSPLSFLSSDEINAYDRYIPNPYHLGYISLPPPEIRQIVTPTALLSVLDKCVPRTSEGEPKSTHNYDIYVGDAGLAALFYHLHQVDPGLEWNHRSPLSISQTYIEHALPLARHAIQKSRSKAVGYLCTPTGPFVVASELYRHLNQTDLAEACVKEWHTWIMHTTSHCEHMEILYGYAGLIYACLLVGYPYEDFVELLIQNKDARFHGKSYLGAAHGKAGILTMLTLAGYASKVKGDIDTLLQMQYQTKTNDGCLVQWCHGVVGYGILFIEAYRAMPAEQQYLDEAVKCGNIVFERGILKKHVGLCHGIAGNAYLFLLLYQITKEPLWLQKCLAFVQIALHWNHGECDHPHSVWEGWGGLAWLMADLISLCTSINELTQTYIGFPGYTDIVPGY